MVRPKQRSAKFRKSVNFVGMNVVLMGLLRMIIDWYYNHSSSDERPSLYLRTRGEDGVLIERHIHPDDEEWCAPFCWVIFGSWK